MKSTKFKEPEDESTILHFCALSSIMISKSKEKFVLAWIGRWHPGKSLFWEHVSASKTGNKSIWLRFRTPSKGLQDFPYWLVISFGEEEKGWGKDSTPLPPSLAVHWQRNILENHNIPPFPLPPTFPFATNRKRVMFVVFFPTISCLFQYVTWHYNIS